MDRIIITLILIMKPNIFTVTIAKLINSIIKWPANIFEINRIDRVRGRITFLVTSIRTINERRIEGVPIGTKWAKTSHRWLTNPQNITDSQIINATGKTIDKWTVGVKLNKDKETVLIKTMKNKPTKEIMFNRDILDNRIFCSLKRISKSVLLINKALGGEWNGLRIIKDRMEKNDTHPQ